MQKKLGNLYIVYFKSLIDKIKGIQIRFENYLIAHCFIAAKIFITWTRWAT